MIEEQVVHMNFVPKQKHKDINFERDRKGKKKGEGKRKGRRFRHEKESEKHLI